MPNSPPKNGKKMQRKRPGNYVTYKKKYLKIFKKTRKIK